MSLLCLAIYSGEEIQLHFINGTEMGSENVLQYLAHVHMIFQYTSVFTVQSSILLQCITTLLQCAQGLCSLKL